MLSLLAYSKLLWSGLFLDYKYTYSFFKIEAVVENIFSLIKKIYIMVLSLFFKKLRYSVVSNNFVKIY